MRKLITAVGVLAMAGIATQYASAATWTGGTSTDWNDGANWDGAVVPSNEVVTINNITAGTTYAPVVSTTPATQPTRIFVGDGAAGTLDIAGGSLAASGTGGGWWDAGAFVLGRNNGGNGTLNMSGGNLGVTGNAWISAWGGTGNWNQTGGTAAISGDFWVGMYQDNNTSQPNGSWGTALVENATLSAVNVAVGRGNTAGSRVDGVMTVGTGGEVNSENDLIVGYAGDGAGWGSQGTLNIQNGGTVNVASTTERWLVMGRWDTIDATVNVNSGGTLNLNAGTDLQVGMNSSGTMLLNVDGGTIVGTAGSTINLNTANSTLSIVNGGLISSADVFAKAGSTIGGNGTIEGNLDLASGALLAFSDTDTLTVMGTLTLASTFGVDDLVVGDWSSVADGVYTLIDVTGDFSGIENFGLANAYDLGGGRSAYFSNGSLQLNVIPEPATIGMVAFFGAGMLFIRRRFMI